MGLGISIPAMGVSIFVVPTAHVKGEEGKKTDRVVVLNSLAQEVLERQRGKHTTHVFVYRREREKQLNKEPVMEYSPIEVMNNTGWQNARKKAGLGDLHVHDLRHTVGMRLRKMGASEATISTVLWHSNKTITAHYSEALFWEIFVALEKIKTESTESNWSLQSLIQNHKAKRGQ